MKTPEPGARGWIAVGVAVAVAEVADSRTMSDYFHEKSRHRVSGPVLATTYAALGLHLFGLIPHDYDPFIMVGNQIRKMRAWTH
jgi:hypothetical protein